MVHPDSAKHIAWAAQNEALFKRWGQTRSKCPDWSITLLFYVAVHEAQAFLLDNGENPQDHKQRNCLLRTRWPRTIWPPYSALQKRSNRSRYLLWMPEPKDIEGAMELLIRFRAHVAAERAATP